MNNIIFEQPKRIVEPYSWIGHIPTAFLLVSELKPKTIVELGVHTGNSFFAFCQAVKKLGLKTMCYGIDTWEGDKHAGYYGDEIYNNVLKYSKDKYKENSILIRKCFDNALNDFKNKSIDLLHIDGLHTYEAVKHDFESWLPKISDKGVIIFHDTNVMRDDFGVYKLWKEISKKYPSFEFKHGYGLGVICVGNKIKEDFKKIANDKDYYIKLFSRLGSYISLKQENISITKEKNEKIKEKDDEIIKLKKDIEEFKTSREKRIKLIKEKEDEIIKLNEKIKDKENKLLKAEQQIKEKDNEIIKLNEKIKEKEDTLNEIYNSKAWKLITKYRKVVGKIRK
jgi:O-antigen biosynthesis protein